jgi:hypothetical protein
MVGRMSGLGGEASRWPTADTGSAAALARAGRESLADIKAPAVARRYRQAALW